MLFLKNETLTVSLLDPLGDRDKLGSRYCAGGYIWQVEDERGGPLLSGPFFPGPTTGFDGQGAPEVFEIALGADAAGIGDEVCVLGVGTVRRESPVKPFHVRDNPMVTRFADWTVKAGENEIAMWAHQSFRDQGAQIARRVRLRGRELESRTEVANTGEASLPLRWFAHPFFPPRERLFRFSLECGVPANPAFEMDAEGFLRRRPDFDWSRGFFQPLQFPLGHPLRAEMEHAKTGTLALHCDFPLAAMPVWGNANAFSIEPYFHTVLTPGASASWSVHYHF
jgi:hypothetical protein